MIYSLKMLWLWWYINWRCYGYDDIFTEDAMVGMIYSLTMLWSWWYINWRCYGYDDIFTDDAMVMMIYPLKLLWLWWCFHWSCYGCDDIFIEDSMILIIYSLKMLWLWRYIHWRCYGWDAIFTEDAMVMMIYSPMYVSTGSRLYICVCYVCNGYICIPSQTPGLILSYPSLCSVYNPLPAMFPWISLAPNQWKTTFYCNVVSHWLSACPKWYLCPPDIFREYWIKPVATILLSVY